MKDLQKAILDEALELLSKEHNTTRDEILSEVAKGNKFVTNNLMRVCVESQKLIEKELA